MIYRNEDNGYTILRLETEDDEVTVVGTMPGLMPGEGLSVHGQWTHHSIYGPQLKAQIVERRMPQGERAVLEYLSSGAVKGVGAATARRLVDEFGEDVLSEARAAVENCRLVIDAGVDLGPGNAPLAELLDMARRAGKLVSFEEYKRQRVTA